MASQRLFHVWINFQSKIEIPWRPYVESCTYKLYLKTNTIKVLVFLSKNKDDKQLLSNQSTMNISTESGSILWFNTYSIPF